MNASDAMAFQPETSPRKTKGGKVIMAVATIVLLGLVAHGVLQRRAAEADLALWTDARAIPTVVVLSPHTGDEPRLFTLPGDVLAFYDAEIHSQVSGYVRIWNRDIGAIVKKGEVLAEIDTPELDEQITQAEQELTRAKDAQTLAETTAQRWGSLRSTAAVSKQASDEKFSDAEVKRADVGAVNAKIARLKAKKAFASVVAPFDGLVTTRNIDIGSLVTPTEGGLPLFKIADIHAMRVYVNAPQTYAASLHEGMVATMSLEQYPGRQFKAKIVATSNAISKSSLTLLVELLAENPDGALQPGAYANVRFSAPQTDQRLHVPSSALVIGRHGVTVATVDDSDRVRFKKIEVHTDYGSEVDVDSGLSPHDRIIDNPLDTLSEGDKVRIRAPAGAEPNSAEGGEPAR